MFNRKDTLLEEAIEAFNNNGAYSFVLNEYISKKKESGIDAEAVLSLVRKIELEEGSAVPLARMTASVKNRVNRSLILISLSESALCGSDAYLYVTRYVSDEMAEELKSKDVNFIDASGNAYIRAGDVYIFIKGNKQAKNQRERMTLLYTPIGLKVLFVLLSNTGIEKSPYRTISALAGVSLGAVSNIFSELKDAGYLYHSNSQLSNLVNKDRLFKNIFYFHCGNPP